MSPNKNIYRNQFILIGLVFVILNFQVNIQAQTRPVDPSSDPRSTTEVVTPTSPATDPSIVPTNIPTGTTSTTPKPLPKKPVSPPKIKETTNPIVIDNNTQIPKSSNKFNIKNIFISALAMIFLGLGVAKLSARNTTENKEKKKRKKCLHLGNIIDANLREITSLEEKVQGMLEDEIQNKAKSKLINTIKKLKDKHEKYSKLFEDCIYKTDEKRGVIIVHIEDSLRTKDWIKELEEKVAKMNFESKTIHALDSRVSENIKNSDKTTIFVFHGNSVDRFTEHLQSSKRDYISSSDIEEVIEKLKSFE